MKRTLVFCLAAALLLSTAHRAPAPGCPKELNSYCCRATMVRKRPELFA